MAEKQVFFCKIRTKICGASLLSYLFLTQVSSVNQICIIKFKRGFIFLRSLPSDSSLRSSQESAQDFPSRKIGLLGRPFGFGWRDKNKVTA